MITGKKIAIAIICTFLTNFFAMCHADEQSAEDQRGERYHNCRFWAETSSDMTDGLIYQQLVSDTNSLKNLATIYNVDGWGYAYHSEAGSSLNLVRGAVRASVDPQFVLIAQQLEILKPQIAMVHVRNCSAGCCCHGCDSIPDPHPFWRNLNGKSWSFIHNGTVDKDLLYELIGPDYLQQNPPNGSGVAECDPEDPEMIVDSELFFLLILKHIELNEWLVEEGIIDALAAIQEESSEEALNFAFSDGFTLWSYRRDRTLFFYDDPAYEYSLVASEYPEEEQGDWVEVRDFELLKLEPDQPVEIINVGDYLPAISGTVLNQDGIPIAGVAVSIPGQTVQTVTAADGSYLLGYPSVGIHSVRFSHSIYSDSLVPDIETLSGEITNLDLTMLNSSFLTGTVTDSEGFPLEDVLVRLLGQVQRDSTDENGQYYLENINSGNYHVRFTHEFYSDTTVLSLPIPADTLLGLNMVMLEGGIVQGIVTNDGSEPIEGVDVVIRGTAYHSVSGADGSYQLRYINAGEYNINFYDDYYSDTLVAQFAVPAGETSTLDMTIGYPAIIAGLVANQNGEPFESTIVMLPEREIIFYTGIDGIFKFDSLDVGELEIFFANEQNQYTFTDTMFLTYDDSVYLDVAMLESYPYIPGDMNMNIGGWPPGAVFGDITYLVNFFRGMQTSQPCYMINLSADGDSVAQYFWASADVNGDCGVYSSDVTKMINIFLGNDIFKFCGYGAVNQFGYYPPKWLDVFNVPPNPPSGWANPNAFCITEVPQRTKIINSKRR